MVGVVCMSFFFFFKQKTAYEMRISDWSSDVCSSDLPGSWEKPPLRWLSAIVGIALIHVAWPVTPPVAFARAARGDVAVISVDHLAVAAVRAAAAGAAPLRPDLQAVDEDARLAARHQIGRATV